jgi:cytochrome P450 PksS
LRGAAHRSGGPGFKANPYPFYTRLRTEEPVCPVVLPDKQIVWLITRYDDVAMVLKDDRFAKDRLKALPPEQLAKQPWVPALFKPLTRNMLDLDPPDHTRLRALVQKAFTPRVIEQVRERIQKLTDDLLDTAAEGWRMVRAIPDVVMFLRYIRKLVKTRRARPQDDLLSALVQVEEAGDQLSEDELLAMIFLLLIAGHETTVNLIGNGALALLEHPDQMEKVRNDPELIKSAVEELLRHSGPLETATERFTREEETVAGVTIPRGALVYTVLASANRDERQFPNPDAVDIAREPNRHLAFGLGIHYCLGAPLARLEGQIAFDTLLRRVSGLRLAVGSEALRWRRGLVLRGLESLPVELSTR